MLLTSKKCPYCKKKLKQAPKRKNKCQFCGNYIYVRKGKLVTDEEAKIDDWIIKLEYYGVSANTFAQTKKQLTKQFGTQPPINDVIWRILNDLVIPGNFACYSYMAQIALEEGKDPKPYIKTKLEQTLLSYKKEKFVTQVEVYTVNDDHVCNSCKALQDIVFDIDEALKKMPVPTLCENELCRCWYEFIVDIDAV